MSRENRVFEFGGFRLDEAERRLSRGERTIPLTPKQFETLLLLVTSPGHLLTKEELIEKLWPDSFVEENALNQKISSLRKVLSNGGAERFIETVPRVGYRFVAPITRRESTPPMSAAPREGPPSSIPANSPALLGAGAGASGPPAIEGHAPLPFAQRGRLSSRTVGVWLVGALAAVVIVGALVSIRPAGVRTVNSIRTIAVLPFKPIGATAGEDFLGLGLADALITRLGYLRQLSVRPTSAVRRFANASKEAAAAGRELAVDAVLEGTTQRVGGNVRVNVQLIGTDSGATLWSAKLDQRDNDLFALEDSISGAVVEALALKLSSDEKDRFSRPAPNPEAYEQCLIGRYYWNQRTAEGFRRAVSAFQEAIRHDAAYAPAHAGLASTYVVMSAFKVLAPSEAFPAAEKEAAEAIHLDPELASPHAALGFAHLFYDWDWPAAEREFLRAIALNPNDATTHQWYSNGLMALGRADAALAEIDKARSLDPVSPMISTVVATHLAYARRPDDAIAQVRRTLGIDPAFSPALVVLGIAHEQKRMYREAIDDLEKASAHSGIDALGYLGQAYALAGETARARDVEARLTAAMREQGVGQFGLVRIASALGERDRAFDYLERMYRSRAADMIWLSTDPTLDALRPDPRLAALVRRVGFGGSASR